MMTKAGGFLLAKMNINISKTDKNEYKYLSKTDNMRPLFGFLGVVVNDDLFSLRLGSSQLLLTILR